MPRLSEVLALVAVDLRGLIAVLAVLLVAVVFGRLLLGRLAALPVYSVFERVLVWVLAGIVAFSWIGVFLAALRLFHWWAVIIAVVAALLVAGWPFGRSRDAGSAPRLSQTPRLAVAAILVLLAVALWLFARPAESYFLVDDSAVYTLGGVVLAREGRLLASASPAIPSTPDFAHSFFARTLFGTISRFYGPFYQYFLGARELEVGFLPLPKVWTALMVWMLGPASATWATPMFGVVGIASLYGLVRRALGWHAALISGLLLTFSLPQIWFARYPISEMAAQVTLLGGLYLAARARDVWLEPALAQRLAAFGGASLALWSVIRLESVVLLPLFAVLLLAGWGRTGWSAGGYARTWLGSLALLSALGWGIGLVVSRHYLFDQSLGLVNSRAAGYAVGVLLIVAIAGVGLRHHLASLLRSRLDRIPRWLWLAVGLVWVAWGLVCLVLLARGRFANSAPEWLTYYLSPLGLVLALGGIVYLVWSRLRPSRAWGEEPLSIPGDRSPGDGGSDRWLPELMALLLVAGLLLVAYSLNPLVFRWQPWAVRRLVPVILPALAAVSAALLAFPLSLLSRQRARPGVWLASGLAVGLLLAQLGLQGTHIRPILFHRELQGFAAQIQAIARQLPAGAVLLFDNGPTAQGLPQAFDLWLDHPSLALRETPVGNATEAVDSLIEGAQVEGRRVFFVATDGDLEWFPTKWDLVGYGARRIDSPVLRPPHGRAPRAEDIVSRSYIMDFYELVPRGSSAATASVEVAGGEGSYPYLREGFYGWDLGVEGAFARWTDGRGEIAVPWPSANPSQPVDVCLQLSVAGGRAGDAAPATLRVQAEGIRVFEQALPKDFAPVQLNILARQVHNVGLDELELSLLSGTWDSPEPGDDRDLGVLFYGLRLLPATDCPQ